MFTEPLINQLTYNLPKLKLCLVREQNYSDKKPILINEPRDAMRYLAPLSLACEEHFVAVHINAMKEVIGLHEISHGTLNMSLVHPREVFKAALIANSYAILVCHNHPSGSAITPSPEDIDTTRKLIAAGNVMGVNVIDHLIIGPRPPDDWYSLREYFPDLWATEQECDAIYS